MEILAMTSEGVLVLVPETQQRSMVPFGDIGSNHPLIRDALSYRLGYLAAMEGVKAANDE